MLDFLFVIYLSSLVFVLTYHIYLNKEFSGLTPRRFQPLIVILCSRRADKILFHGRRQKTSSAKEKSLPNIVIRLWCPSPSQINQCNFTRTLNGPSVWSRRRQESTTEIVFVFKRVNRKKDVSDSITRFGPHDLQGLRRGTRCEAEVWVSWCC